LARLSSGRIAGITLTAVGLILLVTSIPMLMINPKFTAYGYEGGNAQIDLLLNAMVGGIIVLPIGLLFLFRRAKAL
jgi:hypothetical protein